MTARYPDKKRTNRRVLTVIGNRPQFIKAAAVSGPLREVAEEVLVHTGQHYDDALSKVFFDELGLPRPEHRLELGGGSNTAQTSRMLAALEPLLERERPALVLVYGDTNSTLAGALAAAQAGIPVAHVEAGMRSYDRAMPEELNRVLTDHASDLLLCSSEPPADNLRGERVAGEIEVVGEHAVELLRHRAVEGPHPCLDVRDRDPGLGGRERARERRVRVAVDEHERRPLVRHQRLERREHARRLRRVAAAAELEPVLGPRQPQLVEEHLR